MEEDLIAFLLADGALAALVTGGTPPKVNIYWNTRPQSSALPAITLQRISDLPANDEQGAAPLKETRVQVDCWGTSFLSALNVSRAVEALLSGQSFSHNGTAFEAWIDGGGDTTEPGTTSGSVIHRTRIDFLIWHREEN